MPIEKLELGSPDFADENVSRIAELFPNCLTEGVDEAGRTRRMIDFDLLRQELSADVVDGPSERYHLNWPGKRAALREANRPIDKTLRPVRDESVDFDTTRNLFIEGDNLDALKLLQETYLGKVKMIYIDPPYNTGSDFIYRDNFKSAVQDHLEASEQADEEGGRLVANPESNGRYHSDWLSMMYPRLKLARNLLRDDGVIFISIDDHEQAALKKICDEIFGEDNFVAQMVWEKGRKNDAKLLSSGHEYILIYARSVSYIREIGEVWREEKPGARDIWDEFLRLKDAHGEDYSQIEDELSNWYSSLPKTNPTKKWARYKRVDKNGPWRDRDISWPGGDGPKYDVIHPVTKKPCAVPEAGWRFASSKEMQRQIDLGLVEFRDDHTEPPFRKAHIRPIPDELEFDDGDSDTEGETEFATQVRGTYFYKQSQVSVKHLSELMGAKVFTNPKDHEELSKLIQYANPSSDEAIIVDFFAGSASTAEAVMLANANTGNKFTYVTVQLPESLEDAVIATKGSAKTTVRRAVKFAEDLGVPATIAEISKERIRRAGKKLLEESPGLKAELDIGFRVLRIDSSNLHDVRRSAIETTQANLLELVKNIKKDRTDEDLLFQVLLNWGVDLTLPISREETAGKVVHFVSGDALAACFDRGVDEALVKEIAARKPLRAVFRDDAFQDDSTRINVEQLFKQLSPATELRVI